MVKKLSAELQATLAQPAVTQQLTAIGVNPMPMSSADFQAYAAQERAAWESVIKTARIKLE